MPPSRIRWWPGRFAPRSGITARGSTSWIRASKLCGARRRLVVQVAAGARGGRARQTLAGREWPADARSPTAPASCRRCATRWPAKTISWCSLARRFKAPALVPLRQLAEVRAARGKRTRFMALGDYANSRGAADMGLLPDRLPGYASVDDRRSARSFTANCGARTLPESRAWIRAPMLDAAVAGKLKALYVVGANPAKKTAAWRGSRASWQARTADRAGNVLLRNGAAGRHRFAGALRLRKRRHHDQYRRRSSAGAQGRRLHGAALGLRHSAHTVAPTGAPRRGPAHPPAHAGSGVRRNSPATFAGYGVSWAGLLAGAAEPTQPTIGCQRPSACRSVPRA